MGRRVAALLAMLALGACAPAPSFGPVRTPDWQADARISSPILQLSQLATFAGSDIRICRQLRNIGTQPVVIRTLEVEGDSSGVLGMNFYDVRGAWIPPDRPVGFIPSPPPPPPPPRDEDDISIYTILAPGEHADNCKGYALPPGHRYFQAVTSFRPDVDLALVPDRLKAGRIIVDRGFGALLSPPCRIDTRAREVRC